MKDPASQKILSDLQTLARQPGFIYVVSAIIRSDMFFAPDEAAEVDWFNRIHDNELDLIVGFMVKDPIDLSVIPSKDHIESITKEVRRLLDELHKNQTGKFIDSFPQDVDAVRALSDTQKDEIRKSIFGKGENMVEPMFYGDSGAYDFQYLWLVEELYKLDKKWLDDNGIDLELYTMYCHSIKAMVSEKATLVDLSKDASEEILQALCFDAKELSDFASLRLKDRRISQESAQKFIDAFSIKAGEANQKYNRPGSRNDLEAFPIIQVESSRYVITSEFNLAESIYNLPWVWMMQDKSYRSQAEANRGQNIEILIAKMLGKGFGKEVYHSVKIKSGKKTITDIDDLVIVGSKAIVFQAKSKWLTDLAKSGNDDSLADDFKKAIQDAYDQGILSRKSILEHKGLTFELQDGSTIDLSEEIDEVYVVCVTSSVYPAAITQVDHYLKKAEDTDPSTMALSLLDLDILTSYLADPYEFLYYVKQRIDMHEHITATGEIALLGFHLKQRLYRMKPNEHMYVTQQYGQLIDADLLHQIGRADKPKEQYQLQPQSENKTFEQILSELKQSDQPKMTDVIIFLMGLSQHTIDEFTGYIEQRIQDVRNGVRDVEDFSANIDMSGGFTYVVSNDKDKLIKAMQILGTKNKYLHKEDSWISIGTFIGDYPRIASVVQYDDKPWKQNDELEKVVGSFKKSARIKRSTYSPAFPKFVPKPNKKKHKKKKKSR